MAVLAGPEEPDLERAERGAHRRARELSGLVGGGEDARLRRLRVGGLSRDIDELPQPRAFALAQRRQDADRRLRAGVQPGLGQTDPQRRPIAVAALDHRPGCRRHRQIGGSPASLGAG